MFYRSQRVGRGGETFTMYKFQTLRSGTDKTNSFAQQDQYTRFGRFLRKTKLDELPQLWNVLKGDMSFFGYRAEELRHFNLLPEPVREILIKEKPGIIDLASLQFFDEESLLQLGNPHETYWERIRPMKLTLQMFYIQNRSWLLNLAIVWGAAKRIFKSLWVS